MKFNNTVRLVISCVFFFSVLVEAKDFGWGKVSMQGAIIDTACAIEFDSKEQTIDMGTLSLSDVIREGHGRSQSFSIGLVSCMTEYYGKSARKRFSITFDGDSDGELFGVVGGASGVALQIFDAQGNVAIPGKVMPLMNIKPGHNKLNYFLRLVADGKEFQSGGYLSFIRFKLDYF